jgi:rubrerythrin
MLEDVTLRKAVEFAIQTERLGASCYERFAKTFAEDNEIQEIFSRLAKDEAAHEEQFQALLDKVPDKKDEPQGYAEKYGILKAWSISAFFSKRDGLNRALEGVRTRDDALQRALELEKATLGFYQALQDELRDEPVLGAIIAAEKQHLTTLMNVLSTGVKFRGLGETF